MSDSLKDQLLALGLAKAKPTRKPRKKQKPAKPKKKGEISLDEAYRIRQREEKSAAEKKRQLKQEEQIQRRLINSKIQELAKEHRLNDEKAEIKRNFLFKGRIRSVLVTPAQLKQLNSGELSLVFVRGNYHIVKPEIAGQVKALSEDHVPDLTGGDDDGDHPVPDDLVW